MGSEVIEISFNANEKLFLESVFGEVFGGGSTHAIQNVLGHQVEAANSIRPVVEAYAKSNSNVIALTEPQWRVLYEAVHAVIYGLGPTELETCTNTELSEACNINLRICAMVWGVYDGGCRW